jgi:hypothetical protein
MNNCAQPAATPPPSVTSFGNHESLVGVEASSNSKDLLSEVVADPQEADGSFEVFTRELVGVADDEVLNTEA